MGKPTWMKKFPPADGWMRMQMVMSTAEALGAERIKKMATWNKADLYQFGLVEQHGKRVVLILRRKVEAAKDSGSGGPGVELATGAATNGAVCGAGVRTEKGEADGQ